MKAALVGGSGQLGSAPRQTTPAGVDLVTLNRSDLLWRVAAEADVHGIQHWADAGVAAWQDSPVAIQEEALARGLLARAVPECAIHAVYDPTPAQQPAFSVLDTRRTAPALGHELTVWCVNL